LLSFKSVLNQYQTGSEYLETVLLQVLVLLITPNSFGKLSANYYFITVPCLLLHSIIRCCVDSTGRGCVTVKAISFVESVVVSVTQLVYA